jgi:anti-sigma factor RsiW
MKCEECAGGALEEFLDGELDARRAAETSAHLAACRACAARYDELLDEQAMYANYERDLEVTPRALWTGVAARLAAEGQLPRREMSAATAVVVAAARGESLPGRVRAWFASALVVPRFSPALTVALMLLAVGVTAVVMRDTDSQPTAAPREVASSGAPSHTPATPANVVRPTPGATPADAPPNNSSTAGANVPPGEPGKGQPADSPRRKRNAPERKSVAPSNDAAQVLVAGQNNEFNRRQRATEQLVREAESKYLAAIKMLAEDVNRKRTRLDPQVAARFDETLATIDRSIAETRRTVLRQRNDPVAVQYMLSAYAKKVEVMREMAALD